MAIAPLAGFQSTSNLLSGYSKTQNPMEYEVIPRTSRQGDLRSGPYIEDVMQYRISKGRSSRLTALLSSSPTPKRKRQETQFLT